MQQARQALAEATREVNRLKSAEALAVRRSKAAHAQGVGGQEEAEHTASGPCAWRQQTTARLPLVRAHWDTLQQRCSYSPETRWSHSKRADGAIWETCW